jgi:hypothetical protein
MKGKIFNAQEVQSIIAGNKTQFREVIKFSKSKTTRDFQEIALKKILEGFSEYNVCLSDLFKVPYQVGQKIFCKEKFAVTWGERYVQYWADDQVEREDWKKPQPAQHMKQEHSRLTLQIKEIKVERLADFSEEDAKAEGVEGLLVQPDGGSWPYYEGFRAHWNATHKKPEEKFEASPWVWCVTFNKN